MSALFTFAVGFTTSRPLRPDEHTSFVTIAEEDSTRGLLAAQRDAVAMVSGTRRAQMVTSTKLIGVEL